MAGTVSLIYMRLHFLIYVLIARMIFPLGLEKGPIKMKRTCLVRDQLVRFHRWAEISRVYYPADQFDPVRGIVTEVKAIVEFPDGHIELATPEEIIFVQTVSQLMEGA